MFLAALHLFPIKSCKGLSLNELPIEEKGPKWDRRWMITDLKGCFLTQKHCPMMTFIQAKVCEDHLVVLVPSGEEYRLQIPSRGDPKEVVVWKDLCFALDMGDEIAKVLSSFLETECRLVFMPESSKRFVNAKYSTHPHEYGFADSGPIVLISESSLEDLNSRLETQVTMQRFRPNLEVQGCAPYEEDTWKKIQIGKIVFDVVKATSRCARINIDPHTGVQGVEPLQTLSTYRKGEKGIFFGQMLIPQNQGILKKGDLLTVLERQPSLVF